MESLKNKYKGRGLCGLRNRGNTCFINSATQCMSNVLPLTEYILENDFTNLNTNDSQSLHMSVMNNYKDLIDKIWHNNNAVIAPNAFLAALVRLSMTENCAIQFDNSQQDAQEFLVFLIDTLHTALAREVNITINGVVENEIDQMALESMKNWTIYFKSNYSKIIDIFYGQLVSSLTCPECGHVSRAYDPICHFSLPIPEGSQHDIGDCWELFNSIEELDETNRWKCDECKDYRPATKQINIWKSPSIMIVVLKRFKKHSTGGNSHKNNAFVKFSTDRIDLSQYCVGYDRDASIYKLCGVVNHIGDINSGHYFAYCLNGDGKWYYYNDDNVTEIAANNIVTPKAYCLFYEKV